MPDVYQMSAVRAVLGLQQGQIDILVQWGELEIDGNGITKESIHRWISNGKKMTQLEIEVGE